MPHLELSNLTKSFGQTTALKDFSIRAERGEILSILGPSGCGKTTLLHVIAGISRADEGIIRLDGVNIAALSEAGRDRYRAAKIGYVFQTFNLLAGFSALEKIGRAHV